MNQRQRSYWNSYKESLHYCLATIVTVKLFFRGISDQPNQEDALEGKRHSTLALRWGKPPQIYPLFAGIIGV